MREKDTVKTQLVGPASARCPEMPAGAAFVMMFLYSHFFCYSKRVPNKMAQIQTSEKLGIFSQS